LDFDGVGGGNFLAVGVGAVISSAVGVVVAVAAAVVVVAAAVVVEGGVDIVVGKRGGEARGGAGRGEVLLLSTGSTTGAVLIDVRLRGSCGGTLGASMTATVTKKRKRFVFDIRYTCTRTTPSQPK
jgi:hypothetical protein